MNVSTFPSSSSLLSFLVTLFFSLLILAAA